MENNENETKQYDSMISSFFGIEEEQPPQAPTEEELKAQADLDAAELANQQKEPEVIITPVVPAVTEEVNPVVEEKKEAVVLDDQSKWVIDKLSKGEDKEIYDLLRNKYAYDNLTDEDKIMTFLAEKNPHLNKEDLAFKAAMEYGIGATEIEDPELMDDATKRALRAQEIERKGLLNEATKYFEEKIKGVQIPTLPSVLDLDEGYKEYVTYKSQQEQIQKDNDAQALLDKEFEEKTIIKVNETAKTIETLQIEESIDLDQGKFDLKSEFKLDEAKQKQLADYALEYTPTQAEYKAHQDQNGELDMKGYMTMLANKLFESQIRRATVKQALMKDRENFINNELKVSTLGQSTGDMGVTVTEIPFEVSAMSAGGRN